MEWSQQSVKESPGFRGRSGPGGEGFWMSGKALGAAPPSAPAGPVAFLILPTVLSSIHVQFQPIYFQACTPLRTKSGLPFDDGELTH
jgi:hypothetical protein